MKNLRRLKKCLNIFKGRVDNKSINSFRDVGETFINDFDQIIQKWISYIETTLQCGIEKIYENVKLNKDSLLKQLDEVFNLSYDYLKTLYFLFEKNSNLFFKYSKEIMIKLQESKINFNEIKKTFNEGIIKIIDEWNSFKNRIKLIIPSFFLFFILILYDKVLWEYINFLNSTNLNLFLKELTSRIIIHSFVLFLLMYFINNLDIYNFLFLNIIPIQQDLLEKEIELELLQEDLNDWSKIITEKLNVLNYLRCETDDNKNKFVIVDNFKIGEFRFTCEKYENNPFPNNNLLVIRNDKLSHNNYFSINLNGERSLNQ